MSTKPGEKNLRIYNFFRIMAVVLFFGLGIQLFRIQIIEHDEYEAKAISQQTSDIVIEPNRGSITDRNGNILAVSATAYKVVMAPSIIQSDDVREKIADGLSSALSMDRDKILELTKKQTQYVEVARRIEEETANAVNAFIESDDVYSSILTVTEDPKRYYPNGNMLSTVLGFVGSDNQGLEGIEYLYDDYLRGSAGKLIATKTSIGTAMPFEYEKLIDPQDGATITLTVDLEMQEFLETHLENARVEHNVQNRMAGIVMDVKTGEILAISSKPDYDPNDPFTLTDELTLQALSTLTGDEYVAAYNEKVAEYRKNKAIEQYEPGSTFKIITSAMALEEGLVSLTETFNCVGFLKIGSITVKCHKTEGHGTETFKDGLANSCNPVFMTLGFRIGKEKFYDYVTLFGFREKTGVGLPGEQSGYHHALSAMTDLDLANCSFGQSFKITPMQLIAAVSSVANDGNFMQPYIIKEITDSNGNTIVSNTPQVVRRTVSEETSDILCEYLENAVVVGKKAYLPGYHIAGKTGTSQKLDTREDGEDNDKRVASFICFAPASDPQICVLVVVDEPDSEVQYGSYIAAPLGKDIIKDCLDHLNITPDFNAGEEALQVKVPDVTDITVDEASDKLSELNLQVMTVGVGEKVLYQLPSDGQTLMEGNTVMLITDEEEPVSKAVVPDLIGKTAAECNRLLVDSGLNIKIVGENINYPETLSTAQSITAGTEVDKMTVVTVTFG